MSNCIHPESNIYKIDFYLIPGFLRASNDNKDFVIIILGPNNKLNLTNPRVHKD